MKKVIQTLSNAVAAIYWQVINRLEEHYQRNVREYHWDDF